MNERWKTLAAAALVCAVILAFFHETVFRGYSLVPTDIVHELMLPFSANKVHPSVQNHYAVDAVIIDINWARFWQETVRSGQLPLWNPEISAGHPMQAESMPAVFSPFRLLSMLLPFERAFSLGIVLELVLAALFMGAFLRELGLSRWAAIFGAIAYGLNSQFLMWYWRVPSTFAWAPLVLLFAERAFARDSRSYALGSGLVLGVAFLCGSVQASFHLGFLCLAWFVGSLFWRENGGARRFLIHGALIFVIAALVSAVQWLPTLELMRLDAWGSAGVRGPHPDWQQRLLQIPALMHFAIPALTGSTESYDLLKAAGTGRMDFTGYLGLVGFALAWVGGVVGRGRRPVRILLTTSVAVLFVVLATPLVQYVYHRFFILVVFAASVLGAYGLDAIRSGDLRSQISASRVFRWLTAGCLGLVVFLLIFQVFVQRHRDRLEEACWMSVISMRHSPALPHRTDWFRARVGLFLEHYHFTNPAFAIPLGCFFLAVGAWVAGRRGWIRPGAVVPAIVLLNAVDLVGTGRVWVPQVSLDRYPLAPSHPALALMEAGRAEGRVARLGPWAMWLFFPNSLMAYRLGDVQGNASLAPDGPAWIVEDGRLPDQQNLLDLAHVRFVLTDEGFELPPDRFERIWKGDGIRVYGNPTCRPRLQFFTEWKVIPDRKEMWEAMKSGAVDVGRIVLLEKEPVVGVGERGKAGKRESGKAGNWGSRLTEENGGLGGGGLKSEVGGQSFDRINRIAGIERGEDGGRRTEESGFLTQTCPALRGRREAAKGEGRRTDLPRVARGNMERGMRNSDIRRERVALAETEGRARDVNREPLNREPLNPIRCLQATNHQLKATSYQLPATNCPRRAVLRIVEDTPMRVGCEVEVPTAGFVLLADTFYPGWKAFLDGREVEVLRADRFFRAVAVGPGRHELIFRFQSGSFRVGLALTLVGLGVGIGGAWGWRGDGGPGGGGRKTEDGGRRTDD